MNKRIVDFEMEEKKDTLNNKVESSKMNDFQLAEADLSQSLFNTSRLPIFIGNSSKKVKEALGKGIPLVEKINFKEKYLKHEKEKEIEFILYPATIRLESKTKKRKGIILEGNGGINWLRTFPGENERFMLSILIKMACSGFGVYYKEEKKRIAGICLTIKDLRKALKEYGKGSMKTIEIMESLRILRQSMFSINEKQGKKRVKSDYNLLNGLELITEGKQTEIRISFNDLITDRINEYGYRAYDFRLETSLSKLAASLYTQMIDNYRSADLGDSHYHFSMNRILKENGETIETSMFREKFNRFKKILEELKTANIIIDYLTDIKQEKTGKTLKQTDAVFTIFPGEKLVEDQKLATNIKNARQNKTREERRRDFFMDIDDPKEREAIEKIMNRQRAREAVKKA